MIRYSCSKCGKKFQASDDSSGKKVRCPECGIELTPMEPDASQAVSPPGGENAQPSNSCPHCGRELPQGACVCVHCGLDLRTGRPLATTVERSPQRKGPILAGTGRGKKLAIAAVLCVALGVAAVGAFWLTRKGDADNERDGDSASLPRIHAFQGPQPWEFAVRIEAESIPEDKETEAISEFRSMQTLVRPGEYRGIPVLPVLSPRHNANAAYDPESRKGSVESIHHIQLTGKDDAVFLRLEKFPELAKHPADVKPQGWNDLLLWKENDHDVRFQLLYTDYASVVDGLFRGKVQPDGSIRGTVEGTVFLFHGRLAVARCNIKTGAFSLTAAPDSPDRHMNPFGEPAVAFSGQKTWKLKLAYSVPLKKTFHVPDAQKARQYADLRSTAGGGVTLVNDHRTARLIVMCSPTIRLEGDGRKIFLTCEKACSLPRAPKTALPPETLSFDLWESDQRSICFPLRVRVGSLYLDCVVFGKFDATGKLHAVFDGSVFCPSVGMGQSDRYDLVADGNFSLEPVASAD